MDPRQSLALWLRAGRARRQLSLDEVARITKIQPRILERLESGRLEGLPAEVFVKGFVRSFARCVGLDETEALARYGECLQPGTTKVRAFAEVMGIAPSPATSPAPAAQLPPATPELASTPRTVTAEEPVAVAAAVVEPVAAPPVAAPPVAAPPVAAPPVAAPAAEPVAQTGSPVPAPAAPAPRKRDRKKGRSRKKAKSVPATPVAVASSATAAEATAAEPVSIEPTAAEPVAAEPVATEPVAAEPVAAEPVAAEPVAAEPVAAEPEVEAPAEAAPSEAIMAEGSGAMPRVGEPAASEGSADATQGAPWKPTMPPLPAASPPWRRPAIATIAPSLVIDDEDPDRAEREQDARTSAARDQRVSFLPPILLDRDDRAGQGGLTLAVIILLIAATLTLSYLMRRPSVRGDGVTMATPAAHIELG